MLIRLETNRKEEEHKWHATDRRYPLLFMPVTVPVNEYTQTITAIAMRASRIAARERRERRADNT